MPDYIHNDPEFEALIRIVSEKRGVHPVLVEKDYWIMHTLYGLSKQGIDFELKGGTSLSKGYKIISRFSEDIDIHIKTTFGLLVEGKEDKDEVKAARKEFYDVLAGKISIDGIIKVDRDHEFDDTQKYRSGGIKLGYKELGGKLDGVKEGILLEAGYDTVTPNTHVTISSWIVEHLQENDQFKTYIDNIAYEVKCYSPAYTFVEKLQTIVNKHRKELERREQGEAPQVNFMRQYYDVYCLLGMDNVLDFIGSEEYTKHKTARFRGKDKEFELSEHPALLLEDEELLKSFIERYKSSSNLYYAGQPEFTEVLERIQSKMELL